MAPSKSKVGMNRPLIIGVAGGSASGKTTFIRRLTHSLGPEKCSAVFQDDYYIDQSHRFDKDGGQVNFDHPSALDFDLLAQHLRQLKTGLAVQTPLYDFKTHRRKPETTLVEPREFVLVDGMLILSQVQVRELFDFSFFIEADRDTRFRRRLKRDVEERGRTPEGVTAQFNTHVQPMHEQFVDPSKEFATVVVVPAQFDREVRYAAEIIRKGVPK